MTEYLTALYYLVFWVLLPLGAISAIPVLGMYCLFMDIAEKNQEKNKVVKKWPFKIWQTTFNMIQY